MTQGSGQDRWRLQTAWPKEGPGYETSPDNTSAKAASGGESWIGSGQPGEAARWRRSATLLRPINPNFLAPAFEVDRWSQNCGQLRVATLRWRSVEGESGRGTCTTKGRRCFP